MKQVGIWPDGSPKYRAKLVGLFLSNEVQGGGFADGFMKHVEDELRKLGADGINLDAVNVGAYAWARQGYQFAQDGPPSALEAAEVVVHSLLHPFDQLMNPAYWLKDKGAPGTPAEHRAQWDEFRAKLPTTEDIDAYLAGDITALDKMMTPQEIAMYGFDGPHWEHNGIDWWFGKAFLIRNAYWSGFKPLSGPLEEAAAQEIGEFYWQWLAGRKTGKTLDGMWLLDDTDFWQRWREMSGMTTIVSQ
jgi:hypothetical protein